MAGGQVAGGGWWLVAGGWWLMHYNGWCISEAGMVGGFGYLQ
jgi:hypothetical protein